VAAVGFEDWGGYGADEYGAITRWLHFTLLPGLGARRPLPDFLPASDGGQDAHQDLRR